VLVVRPAVITGAVKLVPNIALTSSFLQEVINATPIIVIKNKISFLISVNINNQYFEQVLDLLPYQQTELGKYCGSFA